MKFVLAETAAEAARFIRDNGTHSYYDRMYVLRNVDQLRGVRGPAAELIVLGSAPMRRDYEQIMELARIREVTVRRIGRDAPARIWVTADEHSHMRRRSFDDQVDAYAYFNSLLETRMARTVTVTSSTTASSGATYVTTAATTYPSTSIRSTSTFEALSIRICSGRMPPRLTPDERARVLCGSILAHPLEPVAPPPKGLFDEAVNLDAMPRI